MNFLVDKLNYLLYIMFNQDFEPEREFELECVPDEIWEQLEQEQQLELPFK
jgi:hypothetical protein